MSLFCYVPQFLKFEFSTGFLFSFFAVSSNYIKVCIFFSTTSKKVELEFPTLGGIGYH